MGAGVSSVLGVGREETRRPAEGSSGLGHERRAAIFLMQFILEITEKDFRRRPGVWNGSAEEGASRGAGRGRAGRRSQVTGSPSAAAAALAEEG